MVVDPDSRDFKAISNHGAGMQAVVLAISKDVKTV
jgi:hypothetical protein